MGDGNNAETEIWGITAQFPVTVVDRTLDRDKVEADSRGDKRLTCTLESETVTDNTRLPDATGHVCGRYYECCGSGEGYAKERRRVRDVSYRMSFMLVGL